MISSSYIEFNGSGSFLLSITFINKCLLISSSGVRSFFDGISQMNLLFFISISFIPLIRQQILLYIIKWSLPCFSRSDLNSKLCSRKSKVLEYWFDKLSI